MIFYSIYPDVDPKPVMALLELLLSHSFSSAKNSDNERILEIKNLIYGNIGRKIINKAASNSFIPISFNRSLA